MSSGHIRLHTAPWLFAGTGVVVRRGAVAVDGGTIVEVGPLDDVRRLLPAATVVEWPGVLIPGLVNAHTHLQYSGMADLGKVKYDSFETWSEAFEEEYLRRSDWREGAYAGAQLLLANGTTAAGDVVTHVEALDALHTAGVHGIAYWEVMAWHEADWFDHGRDQVIEVLRHGEVHQVGLSPHAPYSLDTEVLRDLGLLARQYGLRTHVHLAESAFEHDFVATGSGPLAEQWRDWGFAEFALLRQGGSARRPVQYAEDLGVLGPGTHIAHGVYVDAEDRARLRQTSTVVALCPRSNAVIGLDEPPVAAYLREGNAIAVGTDSLASSPSLDVLDDLAELHRIARAQGYAGDDLHARLLEAATAGGAGALGMADRFGTLEPGRLADFTILGIDAHTGADALAEIVESGAGKTIATVIGGETRFSR
ncbi:amidohydrolase family protein [Mycobacterium sp. NBC_00419]|uniref:amidohydrolase family protein n=1 Tax=Mycobacterium sp. NBC_00419 TaxID=2975989 RepID=UPI002E23C1D3